MEQPRFMAGGVSAFTPGACGGVMPFVVMHGTGEQIALDPVVALEAAR
jgi:hypothetical protein